MKILKVILFNSLIYGSIVFPQSANWHLYTNDSTGVQLKPAHTIFYDTGNNVWIGTDNAIIKFDGSNWEQITLCCLNLAITEDHSGKIWIGAENLCTIEGDSIIQYPDSHVEYVNSLTVDLNNDIWVGSTKGLSKFHNGNFVENYDSSNSPLLYSNVDNIVSDNTGKIWGINRNNSTEAQLLFSFDGNNWETFTVHMPSWWNKSMTIDFNNNLWFCGIDPSGYTDTLYEFDGNNWNHYSIPGSLGTNFFPSAIKIDNQNRIWIGCDGSFLMFDGNNFTKVSDEYPGFDSIWVTGITIDDNNNKWLSTWNSGILLYNENGVTSVKSDIGNYYAPGDFNISQNYPNPFNPITNIQYTIGNRQFVSIIVSDMLGRTVATLVNEEKIPGAYQVKFDGNNLSSGVYFYRLQAGNFIQTKKMILLK